MEAWYYKRAGSEFGPISGEELQALFQRGKVTRETEVRKDESAKWIPVAEATGVTLSQPAVPPPLPPAHPSFPQTIAPVKTASGPTVWLWFSALLFVVDLVVLGFIQFVFSVYALFLLAGITGLPDWFVQCVNALDSVLIWPRAAMFVLLILWQGCAFGSILRLYDEGRIQHGRGSGFWWITPVANLFMPFHCLRELRWFSRKRRDVHESGIPAGVVVWLIQAVIILNIIVTFADKLVAAVTSAKPDAVDEAMSTVSTSLNLVSNLGGVAQVLLLTVFVLHNLIHQIRLYRRWNTPANAV